MADDRQVNIVIRTQYEGKGEVDAKKGLKNIEKAAQSASTGVVTGAKDSANGMNNLGAAVGRVFAAFYAAKGVISFFTSSISAANENARAVNTLAAAYQAVGYTAEGAMKQAQAFATKMQNLTGIADEAFLNAQRLLANYGVVGTKAQEAIQAAYALSIGKQMDFASAMDIVSKAAVGQTQTLARYGIQIDKNVQEGEKFDAVLEKINERFGATAQAAMGDAITKTNSLKQAWGDFKEQIGVGLNDGLVPAVDFLTKAVGWLSKAFKMMSTAASVEFDWIITGLKGLRAAFLSLGEYAVKSLKPAVDLISNIPVVGDKIKGVYDNASNSLAEMAKSARQQTVEMARMATPISDIWKTEKGITEEQEAQRKTNEDLVNKKRQLAAATKEAAEAEKKSREEQLKALDNLGLSTSKDLKGWSRDEQSSEPSPNEWEVFAGEENQLGSAADAVAQYDAEAERLQNLRDLKLQYIEQEISDEELKQQALANLETQYQQQQLNNQKNQAKARQQVYASMWSSFTALAGSENKKIAAIGKITGIAQATISTFTGAANALRDVPYPANLAAMASVLAQGLALIGQIQGVKLADGGLVKAVTGGVPAVVGEGGSDEAVLPLDNANAMRRIGGAIAEEGGAVGGVVVNINVAASGGVEAILEQLTDASRNGVVQALEFANLNYKVGAQQQGYSV